MTSWERAVDDMRTYGLPAEPPGGGYLVLCPSQISNWDLVCLLKLAYPNTKMVAQLELPTR